MAKTELTKPGSINSPEDSAATAAYEWENELTDPQRKQWASREVYISVRAENSLARVKVRAKAKAPAGKE